MGIVDFDHREQCIRESFRILDEYWVGGKAFGIENANGLSYGWTNLAMDPKIRYSLQNPVAPNITEKIVQKTKARGYTPTVLSIRFSLLVPAAYWLWFRYESNRFISIADCPNGEDEIHLYRMLETLGNWFFLDKEQLQAYSPSFENNECTYMDLLFPSIP